MLLYPKKALTAYDLCVVTIQEVCKFSVLSFLA